MKDYLIYLFSISTLLIANTTQAFEPSDLKVNLTHAEPEKTEFLVGEPIRFNLEILNLSDEDVTIVRPLDGSSDGMRYPIYQMNVEHPFDLPEISYGRCGNTNNIYEDDFVTIPPQGSYNPTSWFYGEIKPIVAGQYKVSYTVKFDADKQSYEGFMGPFEWTDELNALISKVPRIDLQSNSLTVNVVSNGQTLDSSVHCLMGMPKSEVIRMYYYDEEDFERNMQYIEEYREIANTVSLTFSEGNLVYLHFDDNDVVDGVRVDNNFVSNDYEFEFKTYPLENLLTWIRGQHDDVPQEIVLKNDKTEKIHVGYFAGNLNLTGIKDFKLWD